MVIFVYFVNYLSRCALSLPPNDGGPEARSVIDQMVPCTINTGVFGRALRRRLCLKKDQVRIRKTSMHHYLLRTCLIANHFKRAWSQTPVEDVDCWVYCEPSRPRQYV
jgi:hypothetical protein